MKKITSGHYLGIYKGVEFQVTKLDLHNETLWYWQIGSKSVEDQYSTKRSAIASAMYWIDENCK